MGSVYAAGACEAGCVGSHAWFGEGEGNNRLAGGDGRQPLALDRFVGVVKEGCSDGGELDERAGVEVATRDFLRRDPN